MSGKGRGGKKGQSKSRPDKSKDKSAKPISGDGEEKVSRKQLVAEDALEKLEKVMGIKFTPNQKAAVPFRNKDLLPGKIGIKTVFYANFFRMRLKGNPIWQYDISFAAVAKETEDSVNIGAVGGDVGAKAGRRVPKVLHQQLLVAFRASVGSDIFAGAAYSYDNDRILITNKPLNMPDGQQHYNFEFIEDKTAEGNQPPRRQIFTVSLMKTIELDLMFDMAIINSDPGRARAVLQAVDIINKQIAYQRCTVLRTKIFYPASVKPRQIMENRPGVNSHCELAFGYHQASRLCQGGPMINIDRATVVFYRPGPLLERIVDFLGSEVLNAGPNHAASIATKLIPEFKTLRVETSYHFKRKHTIAAFTDTPCSATYFESNEGRQSVAQYFYNTYGITLQYPNLPAVVYGTRNQYLPIELCELLPNQRNPRKLKEELIKVMTKASTSQKPEDRRKETEQIARTTSVEPSYRDFGIEMNVEMVKVAGRILPAPLLSYKNEKAFKPSLGDWNMQQPANKQFLQTKNLQNWVVFNLSFKVKDAVEPFCYRLTKVGQGLGIDIAKPMKIFHVTKPDELKKRFEECHGRNLQLILCLMPKIDSLYTSIKYHGDTILGVPTQVVLENHYNPRSADKQKMFDVAFLSNLLLKIHTKIGGVNLGLNKDSMPAILKRPTMIIGIDVNHPSPGDNSPSIAALVGSIDQEYAYYSTHVRINESREEIVNVAEMIVPIMEEYKRRRQQYPERIVVYRDGVSDGQFAEVLLQEVSNLLDYLQSVDGKPPLTYIIIQKRHSTRIYPTNPRDRNSTTRSGNILPGSVVDTDICHYKFFDYYLCSQNSFLGTCRPCKYTVLYDENKMSSDHLQQLTYHLCFLFARSTKSISDPAPARYAHHAAARAKTHLKKILMDQSITPEQQARRFNEAINVVANLKNILYFI